MLKEGKTLQFDMEDNVGILTINNPPVNFFGGEFYSELDTFEQFIATQDVHALVINASGKYFSAGIDMNYLKAVSSEFALDRLPWLQRIYSFWQEQSYPVIAAIQGICAGSGTELALGCDIRMAAEGTRFSLPEVMLGLSPDMGGTARLTRLVGVGQAKRMIMTCDEIDAQEALRIGLVEYVVPAEALQQRALKLAKKMAKMPKAAMRFAKKGINATDEGGLQAGLMFEQAQSTYCCGTKEMDDAIEAFVKRLKAK